MFLCEYKFFLEQFLYGTPMMAACEIVEELISNSTLERFIGERFL